MIEDQIINNKKNLIINSNSIKDRIKPKILKYNYLIEDQIIINTSKAEKMALL